MIKTILSLGFGVLLSSSAAFADDIALMMPAATTGGPHQYPLYIGTASDVEKVTICLDALDRCSANSSTSVQATFYKTKAERKVFKLESSLYVQYSSGHGFQNGLGVGVTYDQMRDNALALGAKETVIFTMACHSGGLINSFKRKQAEIDRMRAEGKTLFVMASSTVQQLSSTGPGRDRAEPNAPSGSAGSAFGHALWKALSGEADGEVDGVKDGLIDLSEIEAYTKRRTQQIGGHTPVSIGVNYEHLIMNQIPSRDYLDSLHGGTEGLSETEIATAIEQLEESELAASEL